MTGSTTWKMGNLQKLSSSQVGMFLLLILLSLKRLMVSAQGTEGYFNGSSYVFLYNTINIYGRTSFSFRTCSSGQLLYQEGLATDLIELSLVSSGELRLRWNSNSRETTVNLGSNLIDNRWHDVDLIQNLGTITLTVDRTSSIVANNTYHHDIFDLQLERSRPITIVGRGFTGCILQGAGVVLNVSSVDSHDVTWAKCPLPDRGNCVGYDGDHCFSQPCDKYSKCISLSNDYQCVCSSRYSGRNCEIDMGPLCGMPEFNQCLNGAECQEDMMRNSTSCACLPIFTGHFCETTIENTFCDTNPCRNGATCNINQNQDSYVCTCTQGFAGVDCELNIDECQSFPCQNNGTCTDEINSYTCDCSGTGYRGSNCDVNINECVENNPCYTGSMCFDRYGDYICDCPHGFGGKNCDQEVNECDSNPCQNGGSCSDNLNNYLCHCVAGFAGINCETNIDDCFNAHCPNNSHCVDGINTFSCVCDPGYTGAIPHCKEINECDSMPCLNGGTCIDQLNNYLCTCPHGFNGRFCEINVNECISDPCRQGSTCVDGVGTYTCTCAPGFTGVNCDQDINECEPNPCVNSERCQDMVNNYSCECYPGWEGKNCDLNIDECASQPCLHGLCVDLLSNFSCSCNPGYTGHLCEENINECDSSPCLNGGLCTDMVADFSCLCAHDFMGKNCSLIYDACHSNPCLNNGACLTSVPSRNFTCRCRPGYQGMLCEVDVDECLGVMCPLGQECFNLENRYECGCPFGFTGPTCLININECSSNPCTNGTCVDGIGNYTCVCPPGVEGRHCEKDINECALDPCVHGICKDFPGTFLCYCQPGYTGVKCDIEFNECLSSPCRNNATCNDLINGYSCTCVPGFSGHNCEENINECDSNPCQNGGTCSDQINRFECTCVPGFSGTSCEININECASSPCYNGGLCMDLINSFECNCTDSGFTGLYCETNIDDCASNPCENGASCEDGIKDFRCHCFGGYEGKNCEIDVPECSSSPCLNSGLCLENSNRTLYEINYLGFFPSFSYQTAGGYRCICSSGFRGVNCETNIDDCEVNACSSHGECVDGINDYYCACLPGFEGQYCTEEINECNLLQPCQNGATCEDLVADYTCHCSEGFGDKDCGTQLTGCRINNCLNGAECKPHLSPNVQHEYTCICPQGYHGQHCESVTTVSFNGHGSWTLTQQLPSEVYNISLYFRTTLPDGVLAHGIVLHSQLEYILFLKDSRVDLVISSNGSRVAEFASPLGQNDSFWKKVQVTVENSAASLNISGHTYRKIIPPSGLPINFDTVIGSQRSLLRSPVPDFIGCIQDVFINGEIAIPHNYNSAMEEVEIGCPREDQCISSPCVQGLCKDNWTSYQCICSRPYFGKHCEYSHNAATFGYKNMTSSAKLDVPSSRVAELSNSVEVTFLLRTRSADGLVFYLGSSPIDHFLYNEADVPNNSFMVARLLNGKLQVSLQTSVGNPVDILLDKMMNDGEYHFIQITKDNNKIVVMANETTESRMVSNGPLLSQVLYVAGFPSDHRGKRQVGSLHMQNGLVSYSFENVTNFKGIMQDFRLNNMVVVFYPLDIMESEISSSPPIIGVASMMGTEKGVLSDDLCQPFNPCLRGATCNDIWNEYTCNCPKGYRGKTCDEEEPCNYNSCPSNSECRNLDIGYECVAPASFDGKNHTIRYRVQNLNPSVYNITFMFRSKNSGTILWLENHDPMDPFRNFLQVELLNGSSSLEVKWDFSNPPAAIKTISKELDNNGGWYRVEILFKQRVVELLVSSLASPSPRDGIPQLSEDNYLKPLGEVLRNDSSVFLGYSPEGGSLFKGCLDEVRIGGLLLPFFPSAVLPNSGNPFITETNNVEIGCTLCWNEDCIHGSCNDSRNSYACDCHGGYEGEFCSIDLCDSQNPCANDGQCYHHIDDILCKCTQYFTGSNCTIVDKCASSPCMNNGFCTHNLEKDDYECDCRNGYEGKNCEKRKIVDCSSSPCKHGDCEDVNFSSSVKYKCHCFDGYEGNNCDRVQDLCQSSPCGNYGNCSLIEISATYQCDCIPGFTGRHCETNIDECDSLPCGHGNCIDGIGNYSCSCYPGYQGTTCHERISSCYSNSQVCFSGTCRNTDDGYRCECDPGYFGRHCKVADECELDKCNGRGTCNPMHDMSERMFMFNCTCKDGYAGIRCSEKLSISGSQDDDTSLVLMILIPVMTLFILCLLIGAVVFLRIAKKKRATRGTYSPSRQEMFGSRVEMNHVMKPPPEERLI